MSLQRVSVSCKISLHCCSFVSIKDIDFLSIQYSFISPWDSSFLFCTLLPPTLGREVMFSVPCVSRGLWKLRFAPLPLTKTDKYGHSVSIITKRPLLIKWITFLGFLANVVSTSMIRQEYFPSRISYPLTIRKPSSRVQLENSEILNQAVMLKHVLQSLSLLYQNWSPIMPSFYMTLIIKCNLWRQMRRIL